MQLAHRNKTSNTHKDNWSILTTAIMESAYNQITLEKQSHRLTEFVIGNRQYEIIRLFYGISIGTAAFSAFMSKIVRPRIPSKR